ncbi:MAG: pyruvate kinase [Ruminococcaceae bacterium]|nr:pyruvate kinase [Oscillospiraceae bacterium]
MIKTYATLGPACCEVETLSAMLRLGLTGFRLNLSHRTLDDCKKWTDALRAAGEAAGVRPELIIDLRGGELRLGDLTRPLILRSGDTIRFGKMGLPLLDDDILAALRPGQQMLIDDGAIELVVEAHDGETAVCRCIRGGMLEGRKSITLPGVEIPRPAVSQADHDDLAAARDHGVTAVMQPFVRSRQDLLQVREALRQHDLEDVTIFAKVEDADGLATVGEWLDLCDVVTIARGDLGSNLPLCDLPRAQKQIAAICRAAGKDFLVVTHLLQSMIHAPVPTRAEVTDIYNACLDGAAALMLTGETAQGKHGVEAVRILLEMARRGEADR